MRATLMYGAGDVRVEQVPDSVIKLPTDVLVRVTASCICGSDLWSYGSMKPEDDPARMGHEFIGIVEDTGPEVTTLTRGDLVVAPFAISAERPVSAVPAPTTADEPSSALNRRSFIAVSTAVGGAVVAGGRIAGTSLTAPQEAAATEAPLSGRVSLIVNGERHAR
ncbi:alcohol dehydrogenase catalytic domain-containing protein [Nonomuraea sp. NPDC049709]|uniref:alcohol dehydrogenase catalytic domain-containing protein n=1 Tax=Nonomuraea sp. NPDC049709 TaxID=3154736 RepID=UPI003432F5F7